jgi:uncharacterized membrane protein YphA (DoxX/SURF4 family)
MYEKLRNNRFNQWLIIHLRYLLGFAFIPSGLVKLVGNRFTQISAEVPIGLFFEGLYQSGFYYNLIGFIQVFTGFLLMSQRFATLGALIYSCVIFNIWMITVSLSFKGTWIITSLMLFATLILLVWDFQKLKFIFSYNSESVYKKYVDPSLYWQLLGVVYFVLLSAVWIFASNRNVSGTIALLVIIVLIVSNIVAYKKYRNDSIR